MRGGSALLLLLLVPLLLLLLLFELSPQAQAVEELGGDGLVAALEGDGVVPALAVAGQGEGGALEAGDAALEVIGDGGRAGGAVGQGQG